MEININIEFKRKIKVDVILLTILAVAAFLRFYHIGFQQSWLDEISTMQVSDPDISFAETHILVMTREGFPHLYFLCLKYLSLVFGHSIVVLRLFSAVFGIASVYVIYLFAKELIGKNAGYISAILLTVNFFHIYHSQEARCYTLLVFFGIYAAYRLLRYIKEPTMIRAVLMGISIGLITHAHPIGILNCVALYATLFVFFLMQHDKKKTFIQLFVSGILSLLVFWPVYQIYEHLSKIDSFWIAETNLKLIKDAFVDLLGGSAYFLYIYLLCLVLFYGIMILRIRKNGGIKANQMEIITLVLFSSWLIFNIGVIIAKSYLDVTMIVNRYFIGSLAVFIVMAAYCVTQIGSKYVRISLVAAFTIFSLYFIYQKKYYTTIAKSQWQDLAKDVADSNTQNDRIYGTYGYVCDILFKGTPSYRLTKETPLDAYLKTVKNKLIEKEAFWFFDGNQRPYNLNAEDQQFLDENYVLDKQIEKFDCWARHYVVKGGTAKASPKVATNEIFLSSFNPKVIDNEGNLWMFSNQTISTNPVILQKGKYEIELHANSMPETKIDNENAHITLKLNDKVIVSDFLSEKLQNKKKLYTFTVSDLTPKTVSLSFDNDIAKGDLDRNVIIYFIKLKKIGD